MSDESHPTSLNIKNSPKKDFISVIIPVYKDVEGLTETVSSLMKQTIPQSNYEVIVANDGGDEGVGDFCEKYPIREIRIIPNRGSYYARNRGIEEARGEFLAFVDADITVPGEWLETGLQGLQTADYIGGPVLINEKKVRTPAHYYELVTGFKGNVPEADNHFFVTANLFVRRSVFEHVGGFDIRLRSGGDNEFGNRVFNSNTFTQSFIQELAVLHPPRGFHKLLKKRVRITEGKLALNRLYPERYRYEIASPGTLIARLSMPPSISGVKKTFKKNNHFRFWLYYLFIWYFKIRVTLKLVPVLLRK